MAEKMASSGERVSRVCANGPFARTDSVAAQTLQSPSKDEQQKGTLPDRRVLSELRTLDF